jgi:signal transduction histidine kinase
MHDDLSQRLAASAIEAGNLEQKFRESPESFKALGLLKDNLIAICDDVHRLSRQIHPAILDDFGLADALHSECDRHRDREGISVEFLCGDLPQNIPKDIALCLYRIAQEAFWNAAKYAHSDRMVVELNSDPEFIHLEVRDFGCGFDSSQVSAQNGLGLASMKERARLLRGTISILSAPGDGVTISVQVPFPEQAA